MEKENFRLRKSSIIRKESADDEHKGTILFPLQISERNLKIQKTKIEEIKQNYFKEKVIILKQTAKIINSNKKSNKTTKTEIKTNEINPLKKNLEHDFQKIQTEKWRFDI